jgi:hypothetical protein
MPRGDSATLPADQLPWRPIARNVIFNESRSARRRDRLTARVAAERSAADHQPAASWASDGGDDAGANAAAARGLTSSCRRSFAAITEYR